MKIVTWNINSIRLRINLLGKLSKELMPDIIALQETKCSDELFPAEQVNDMGYEHIVFSGQKSYNGVAILSKLPIQSSFTIPIYNNDKRHIACRVGNIELHNFYVPAGGDIPDIELNPKYKHKLEYVKQMEHWFIQNRLGSKNIILVGDLNIAPYEHDVWSSRQLRNVISHTEPEKTALNSLRNKIDFIDSARFFTSMEEKFYTWWSYRNRDWQKSNRGRRLDHIWTSRDLEANLKNAYIIRDARNWDTPSDHVPFVLEIE